MILQVSRMTDLTTPGSAPDPANDATGGFCKIYSHKFLHAVFAQQEHKHNCLDKHACASHVTP